MIYSLQLFLKVLFRSGCLGFHFSSGLFKRRLSFPIFLFHFLILCTARFVIVFDCIRGIFKSCFQQNLDYSKLRSH